MLKRGAWFTGTQSLDEVMRVAKAVERKGMDSAWVADGYYGRDPFVTLSAIAGATNVLELGTGVTSPHLRHPATLATSFATLDELSGGRVLCGVGNGSRDQLAELGLECASPLGAMREAVVILKALLSGGGVELTGSKFSAHVPRLAFRPRRLHVPLYLAAVGPKMCALAGELADGVFFQYGSPDFVTTARRAVEAGFDRRGEAPTDYVFAVATVMSVAEHGHEAMDRVRATVGRLLTEPNAEMVLESNGLDPGLADQIRVGLRERGIRGMAECVTDEVVDRLAVAGNTEHCRRRLQAVIDAGGNHIAVTVQNEEIELALDVLEALHE